MKKVLVVGGYESYYKPFYPFGDKTSDEKILDRNPDDVLFAIFTGGEDVDPSMYGHKPSKRTCSNIDRDLFEKKVYDRIRELDIPCVGICRGAQFLCAMAGGKLVQHLDSHGGFPHNMRLNDGSVIEVNSLHHQAMLPKCSDGKISDVEHVLLGWSDPPLSKRYIGENDELIDTPVEYEVVYFPQIKSLCFQYHPEMMHHRSEGHTYCVKQTEKLLKGSL